MKREEEDRATFIEMLKHLRMWWLTCPLFDKSPHIYHSRLGSEWHECLTCGKIFYEKLSEGERELDRRVRKAFRDFEEDEE